jgi:hypothetical protein
MKRGLDEEVFGWCLVIVVIATMLVAFGCTTPSPVPDPPGPTPTTDVFDHAIINCELPVVAEESPALESVVRGCLVGESTAACLTDLTEGYHVDAVACVVRRLGHDANKRVLAGQVRVDDTTVDESARAWIRQKAIGYR